MSFTRTLTKVYCQAVGTAVGRREKDGPLGSMFDSAFDDDRCGEKTYESGELRLFGTALEHCLRKAHLEPAAVDLLVAGDLNNQLACSSKGASYTDIPFAGVYGACATSMLGNALGALLIEAGQAQNVLVGATSSFGTSERQFRYPQEYGLPKKESTTTTVTGSAFALLSTKESKVRLGALTIGEVTSPASYDVTDMGTPMALAAYKTIKDHLDNRHETLFDYDLILTGDLSKVGSSMLRSLFAEDGQKLFNHSDCGELIFDLQRQKVYSGGSGTACCPLVTYTYIFDKLIRGVFHKVLVVATGALHDPVYVWQKKTIPTVAHAIVFERN